MHKYFLFVLHPLKPINEQYATGQYEIVQQLINTKVLPMIKTKDPMFEDEHFVGMEIDMVPRVACFPIFMLKTNLKRSEMNEILWDHIKLFNFLLIDVHNSVTINGPTPLVNMLSEFLEINMIKNTSYDMNDTEMKGLSVEKLNDLLNEALSREDYGKCSAIKSIIDQKQLNNETN